MKIYLAGHGHTFADTSFEKVLFKEKTKFLISYMFWYPHRWRMIIKNHNQINKKESQ